MPFLCAGCEPQPGPWGARQTALAVAVAAVIAGLGGAAIYAAAGQQSAQVTGPPGMGPGRPAGPVCEPTR